MKKKLETLNQVKLIKQTEYFEFLDEVFKEAHYRWAVRICYYKRNYFLRSTKVT